MGVPKKVGKKAIWTEITTYHALHVKFGTCSNRLQ